MVKVVLSPVTVEAVDVRSVETVELGPVTAVDVDDGPVASPDTGTVEAVDVHSVVTVELDPVTLVVSHLGSVTESQTGRFPGPALQK